MRVQTSRFCREYYGTTTVLLGYYLRCLEGADEQVLQLLVHEPPVAVGVDQLEELAFLLFVHVPARPPTAAVAQAARKKKVRGGAAAAAPAAAATAAAAPAL